MHLDFLNIFSLLQNYHKPNQTKILSKSNRAIFSLKDFKFTEMIAILIV